MIILVDVGNTQLKWALLHAGELEFCGAKRYQTELFENILPSCLGSCDKPERVLISNVAGQAVAEKLRAWLQQHWKISAEFITAQPQQNGLVNAYGEPNKLGSDRWLGLIAAREHYSGPLCAIGCGTAITIDAVTKEGQHLGGLIAPGLELMRLSLAEHTDGCGMTKGHLSRDISLLGKNTQDAIINGGVQMATAFIDSIMKELFAELGHYLTFIATGGDAMTLIPRLQQKCHYHPYLVLEGLAIIAQGDKPSDFA